MPGYEYCFVVLQYHISENAQGAALGSPIKTHAGFTNLAKQGWRVRTAVEIRRSDRPELMMILGSVALVSVMLCLVGPSDESNNGRVVGGEPGVAHAKIQLHRRVWWQRP
jgi:hypothetical protein